MDRFDNEEIFQEEAGIFPSLKALYDEANRGSNLDDHHHIAVVAGSGHGKTRALRELMVRCNSGVCLEKCVLRHDSRQLTVQTDASRFI